MKAFTTILSVAMAAVVAVSCGAQKEISYFQDLDSRKWPSDVRQKLPEVICLRPEDKVSIVVNCKDAQLTSLFNLPYVSKKLGDQSESYNGTNQGISGYTVTSSGDIDFPIIGKVHVGGLTREEVASKIKGELTRRNLVKDPVVTVEFMNLFVSVLGEVAHPGRFSIYNDRLTILDVIAMAGDLTITGKRDNVTVIREVDGSLRSYSVNLNSYEQTVSSEVFNVRQNDIIYVEPNKMKARQSTVNGNNVLSAPFWISVASLVSTLTLAIVAAAK